MIEQIASGLIVAAIGSLFYLAYSHPKVFLSFQSLIDSLVMGIFLMVVGYDIGIETAVTEMISSDIPYSTLKKATGNVDPNTFTLIAFFCIYKVVWYILVNGITKLKDYDQEGEKTDKKAK